MCLHPETPYCLKRGLCPKKRKIQILWMPDEVAIGYAPDKVIRLCLCWMELSSLPVKGLDLGNDTVPVAGPFDHAVAFSEAASQGC